MGILKKPHSFVFSGFDPVERNIRWYERVLLVFLPNRVDWYGEIGIVWKFWRGRHYLLREIHREG